MIELPRRAFRRALLLAFLAPAVLASAARAHHSSAAYDNEHPQTVEGTVRQVNWANPHVNFVVETDGKEGPLSGTWSFEASSPGVLTRSGWTKRSLKPGDHAVFVFGPLRDGKPGGILHRVTLPGGEVLTYSLNAPDE